MDNTDIVMSASMWQEVRNRLFQQQQSSVDQPVFLLAGSSTSPFRRKLLARELLAPHPDCLTFAQYRCWEEGWNIIEVRSQPLSVEQEALRLRSTEKFGQPLHAVLVVREESITAILYGLATGTVDPIRQLVIIGVGQDGSNLRFLPTMGEDLGAETLPASARYQRQEIIIGRQGQERLHATTIAIVGTGGLGAFAALELAHLGVGHLILIDPEPVEETNLNRLLGTTRKDIGQKKVQVLAKRIEDIWEGATVVTPLPYALLDEEALSWAKGADILLGCVDNFGARRVLNQLAVRYLIPLIDGGSGVHRATNTTPLEIGGQVQLVLPDIGCLECRGFIAPDRALFDTASPEEQANIRLRYGTGEVAPSVVSLNGVIASLQVNEVLYLLSPLPTASVLPPISQYDALARNIERIIPNAVAGCPTCGVDGVWAVGDVAPLQKASGDLSADAVPDIAEGDINA